MVDLPLFVLLPLVSLTLVITTNKSLVMYLVPLVKWRLIMRTLVITMVTVTLVITMLIGTLVIAMGIVALVKRHLIVLTVLIRTLFVLNLIV
jgi:hypothetical protein